MDGKDQPATSQMSEMDTPLNHAQEEAMPLVEWALTPIGHCNPEEEYANVIEKMRKALWPGLWMEWRAP